MLIQFHVGFAFLPCHGSDRGVHLLNQLKYVLHSIATEDTSNIYILSCVHEHKLLFLSVCFLERKYYLHVTAQNTVDD